MEYQDRPWLPRTGELLRTVNCMVRTLAAAGELQRELQRELTCGGLRAAEAKATWAYAAPQPAIAGVSRPTASKSDAARRGTPGTVMKSGKVVV